MKNGPRAGSHAQTESQRPHIKIIWTKLKIMDKDKDLALYRDRCRSLSITISRDGFNAKKHRALYLDFSKGLSSKVLSINITILPFF